MQPGLYIVNSTGETIPVLTEGNEGDFQLLEEYLYEKGFELATRDLESFVETKEYVTDCDECARPLPHDEANEFGFGTLCGHCADGREETARE